MSKTNTASFPFKLFTLLNDADKENLNHIVSWLPDRRGFKVHEPKEFSGSLMKQYFKQSQYKSFTRQLYIYGFTKISQGPNKGGFFHPSFLRDDMQLSLSLKRNLFSDRRSKAERANKKAILSQLNPGYANTDATKSCKSLEAPSSSRARLSAPRSILAPPVFSEGVYGSSQSRQTTNSSTHRQLDLINETVRIIGSDLPEPCSSSAVETRNITEEDRTLLDQLLGSSMSELPVDILEPRPIEEMLHPETFLW